VKRFYILAALILLIVAALLYLIFMRRIIFPPSITRPGATPTSIVIHWGARTKTSGCTVRGSLQDPSCTPGDILPGITTAQVCQSGYASSVRSVTTRIKNKVYAEYGIKKRKPKQYEIDHLVNLSIGGSNDITNLWPQAAKPAPGFPQKDRVENYLRNQVCTGKISLQEAQIEIATNWLAVYNRMPKREKTPALNDPGEP
jgi:hypothetical protein